MTCKSVDALHNSRAVVYKQIFERPSGKSLEMAIGRLRRNLGENFYDGLKAQLWIVARNISIQVQLARQGLRVWPFGRPLLDPCTCDVIG